MTWRTSDNIKKVQSHDDQQMIVHALQVLFDLLENYGPAWYSQEHHDLASEALAIARGRKPRSSAQHSTQGRRRTA